MPPPAEGRPRRRVSYQIALVGRRIKMDLEAIACQNQASGA
jgi:hypothetical protein